MKIKYHYNNNFTIEPMRYNDLLLYQLGEMMCDVDTVIDSHVHLDWFEFTYVFSGSGTVYTNNQSQAVSQNSIYFSMPREIHKIVSDNINPLRYFFCAFNVTDDSPLKPYLDEYALIISKQNKRCFVREDLTVHFHNFLQYIKSESRLSKAILEHELKTVILKGLSLLRADKIEAYTTPKVDNMQMLCFNIISYIDANIVSMENVACLSETFRYNYSYLSRCFKKTIGESISEYFNNKKLSLAKKMIEQGDLSITEIATTLHYSSIYVFSRAFKEKYKNSPNHYKHGVTKRNIDATDNQ